MSDTPRPDGLPGPIRPRGTGDFDALYQGTPPWDIGRSQPAFANLASAGALKGRVLDVGCGTGEHALMAAALGLPTVGIDAAPTAIAAAEEKARARRIDARFVCGNALELAALGQQFDTVLDSGLFHVFEDDDRARYVESLAAVVAPGGHYYLLCFSDKQPGDWGPRRITASEIEASFGDGWIVETIVAATFDVTYSEVGAAAWLATISRG